MKKKFLSLPRLMLLCAIFVLIKHNEKVVLISEFFFCVGVNSTYIDK